MLPHLPEGSTYTGIDFAEELISFGKMEYEGTPWNVQFIESDFLQYKSARKYDMIIEQAVLRHINNPEEFLQKMVSHAKQGRDYAVAMRVPDMMRKIGLYDIEVRMNDKVNYVTP